MQIELTRIEIEEKDKLKMMLLAYFKEIDDSKIIRTTKGEELDYPFLDSYWKETNRIPLAILYNNEIVGFILINDWIVCKEYNATKSIAEFYIKPMFRRKGIGKKAAHRLFNQYTGRWEIRQSSTNFSAIKFWKEIIAEFTSSNFVELKNKTGDKVEFVQIFES